MCGWNVWNAKLIVKKRVKKTLCCAGLLKHNKRVFVYERVVLWLMKNHVTNMMNVCLAVHGKYFTLGFFLRVCKSRFFRLAMLITAVELYAFILVLVTLTKI